ncbi:uncharacterized protein LOC129189298 isoform X2 [Dunckerocampus dactyliophorus]|nr:uncharacterized protein LOC129189298 isoform X2 [Dunckerocampus dactyliophorus]XP_054646843.1 uncharacterized protein LOC129189298 isoform X2 [Dunckerocampus dactyliophorus]
MKKTSAAELLRASDAQSAPDVLDASGDAVLPPRVPLPCPPELTFLLPEVAKPKEAPEPAQETSSAAASTLAASEPQPEQGPHSQPTAAINMLHPPPLPSPPPPQLLPYDQEVGHWNCTPQQRQWMKLELESMGLWPGSRPVSSPMTTFSLWRLPPQPELISSESDLPSPKCFHLHPFFIWKPENDYLMGRLKSNYTLPCTGDCAQPRVASAGVGRPRVIVGLTGQYYLLSSRLCCKSCRRKWYADNPLWLEKLPQRFTNLLPALLTYKKAICKSVLDELRRTGKSPTDMANQITEMLHLKYERANLAYLLCCQNVMDDKAGTCGKKTNRKPEPFGGYSDADGWNGVSVSAQYLTDCLLREFQHQRDTIQKLLQGTFGQALRSDHSHKVAKNVTFSSGAMSSYAVMNENWMILSWVMVQSVTEKTLRPMYEGLSNRYSRAGIEKAQYQWVDRDCCAPFRVAESLAGEHLNWDAWRTTDRIVAEVTSGNLLNNCASRTYYNTSITVKLDLFGCMGRFLRECASEHHPLYSSFAQFLSAAFSVVDQEDLQRLQDAYVFCGIQPANPTKQHIREHCRVKIPQPGELIQRVEGVLQHFYLTTDPNGLPLFKPSMLKTWRIQRVHILRGCLSDPEVEGAILYRHGGTLQLNHVPGERATVPVWIPIRGTSQKEGFHFHQAQWVTGTQVSPELFQAQSMTGVCRWNYQRLLDLKQPGVCLPRVFDPALMHTLNVVSKRVLGEEKYPGLYLAAEDTGERFGLEYREPDCRPVPLDWDKHKSKKDPDCTTLVCSVPSACTLSDEGSEPVQPSATPPTRLFKFSVHPPLFHTTTPDTITTTTTTTTAAPVPAADCDSASGSVFPVSEPQPKSDSTPLLLMDPPPPAQTLTTAILEKEQQHQQPTPLSKKPHTKKCLYCGQPKSKYKGDGRSIHEFYQQGPVRYFYCSTKVFETYRAEGLTCSKMPLKDFVKTDFFQRELDATKKRVEEKQQKKRKREEFTTPRRKCRFCKMELRQGPNSPHIHTGFPGLPGKYIYCPAKVFSIYRQQGMEKEMSWREFQDSPFYEKEKQRWGSS